jgi:hypothetical protein
MSPTTAPALELVPASRRRAAILPGTDVASKGGMPSMPAEETLESSSGTALCVATIISPFPPSLVETDPARQGRERIRRRRIRSREGISGDGGAACRPPWGSYPGRLRAASSPTTEEGARFEARWRRPWLCCPCLCGTARSRWGRPRVVGPPPPGGGTSSTRNTKETGGQRHFGVLLQEAAATLSP